MKKKIFGLVISLLVSCFNLSAIAYEWMDSDSCPHDGTQEWMVDYIWYESLNDDEHIQHIIYTINCWNCKHELAVEQIDYILPHYYEWEANCLECGNTQMSDSDIKIKINGQCVNPDVPARIINNKTMVSMRAICELLGMDIEWDDYTKTVRAREKNGEVCIVAQIGNNILNFDYLYGETWNIYLDSAPVIVDGTTLVPIREFAMGLGCVVEWDKNTKTVCISY